MKGKLYGVSVGPGDPELLTIKAARIIEKCGVIASPVTHGSNCAALSIARGACDLSGKTVLKLAFTMSRDESVLSESRNAAAEQIVSFLDGGEDVAFVCIGDISVYSTFSYIAEIISRRGFEFEICPGVTSFCAAAAAAKRPLVLGSEPLIVIPADCAELDELCERGGTKVVMKSGKAASAITEKLQGRDVYAAENVGYEDERIYTSLDEIADSGYFTTIIFK